MANEGRLLGIDVIKECNEVARKPVAPVGRDITRCRRRPVAALVGDEHAIARVDQGVNLMPPAVLALWPAMTKHDHRIAGRARVDHIKIDATEVIGRVDPPKP